MNFEDFLGNTVEEGDVILYAGMSGRSVQMIKARVLTIREKSVTVEPMDSARWRQHYGREKYLDDKGKPFDPYGPKAGKHTERPSGRLHKETGEFVTEAGRRHAEEVIRAKHGNPSYYHRDACHAMHKEMEDYNRQYEYAPVVWKDYVKIEKVISKVTLTVLQNIVLIERGARDGN